MRFKMLFTIGRARFQIALQAQLTVDAVVVVAVFELLLTVILPVKSKLLAPALSYK